MNKRAGLYHGVNAELPGRPLNDITVHCPACPEPGVNMDESDWVDIPDDQRYVFLYFLFCV